MTGTPPLYNALATGGPPTSPLATPPVEQTLDLTAFKGLLVPGVNVLAVQGHNAELNSRDLLMIPQLSSTLGCTTNGECDDGLYCNGAETCNLGTSTCEAGTPPTCDDGVACTVDSCNETGNRCDHTPNDPACSDANLCNGVETCDEVSGCELGTVLDCTDAVDCTTDTCLPATGCQHADNCTGGLVCNPAPLPGQCEAPPVDPLPIDIGEVWSYFKGTTEPSTPVQLPPLWALAGFDDSSWLSGASGIGYGETGTGNDCEAQRGTTLTDMNGAYASVYMRKEFFVGDPASIYGLQLTMYFDDAFVAYLNGQEVARSSVSGTPNIAGTPPQCTARATVGSECVSTSPGTYDIDKSKLVSGINVLAIQGHNGTTLTSTDFIIAPKLEIVQAPNQAPNQPTNPSPADGATNVLLNPDLCVDVSDPDGQPLNVTFYGREQTGLAGDPFTIVVLPDPQYYSNNYPATYDAVTQWVADNRTSRNIVFFTSVGDMTDGNNTTQWDVVDAAFDILDAASVPNGFAIGNHDGSPSTTTLYNEYFGEARYSGRSYYGGHYGSDNDNNYMLFSASGMDFIMFHLETEMGAASSTCQAVRDWANDLLTNTYPNHRAIIVSHYLMSPTGSPPAFTTHGQALYDAFKDNRNVFLMMSGHLDQANHRVDANTVDGKPIYSLLSDYQFAANGGNGWLRILTFDPQNDQIHVETFSPTAVTGGGFINKPTAHSDNRIPSDDLCTRDCYVEPGGTYAAGGNELMLPYDMDAGLPFTNLGTNAGVASGGRTCLSWPGRAMDTPYEWDVTVSDGSLTTTGPRWDFRTATTCDDDTDCNDNLWCNGAETCNLATFTCVDGTPPVCADGFNCTTDSCNESTDSCDYVPNHGACTDSNACTDDTCDPALGDPVTGCRFVNDDSNACSDNNACTAPDTCSAGNCGSGSAVICNDGVACTNDFCAPASGCQFVSNCPTGWSCNLGTGICEEFCASDPDCDDSDVCTTDVCNLPNAAALSFDGTNDYVTMGAAPGLNAAQFTIETWFKWTGSGVSATTGSGGVSSLIPLVTKGQGEGDTPANINENYVFGISGGRLAGDFEDTATGLNHPVCAAMGTPTITTNEWHHAAATYDGSCWALYLDGVALPIDTSCSDCVAGACTVCPGATPQYSSIQHFGLGAMLNSGGAATGRYQGQLDEVRVWNRALSQAEIQANMNAAVTSGTGLIGRWGLEEGTGANVDDSTDPEEDGTLKPDAATGPTWTGDAPALGDGTCEHTAVPGCCNTGADCSDGNACTDDVCNASNQCEHSNSTAVCDDLLWCTVGDVCSGGTCAGAARDCADTNSCTADGCDEASDECIHDPAPRNGATCDDGLFCNIGETCLNGACQGGSANVCDDTNACTADSCDETGSVCVNNPIPLNGTSCEDGNLCTNPDACSNGACTGAWTPNCCTTDAQCNDGLLCTSDFCPLSSTAAAVSFDGTDDYITMGVAPNLNAANFTVECWFRWTGGGGGVSTGTGGTTLYPLVAKGYGEGDGGNVDEAYILGVRSTGDAVLAADFEEGPGGPVKPGENHPINGTTVITQNAWHHAAVTYNGSCWKLYLDGVEDTLSGTACPNAPNRSDNTQHFGIGTLLSSTGARNGAFKGQVDEVRVWNRALSKAEIQANFTRELTSGMGLIGRWGLNEGLGATTADSTTPGETGILTNGAAWFTSPLYNFGTANVCEHDPIANCCDTAADCSDGNACSEDTCVGNVCQHAALPGCCLTAAECNDGIPCTDDACSNNACVHTNNTAPCNDGHSCTLNDACSGGTCVGTPVPDCCENDGMCDDASSCTTDACGGIDSGALSFDGANDYVTMGAAPGLGSAQFTLETWFKRTGTGVGNTTGGGGIASLVPLVTKGAPQADGSNLDANYVMGINTAGNVLAADFEDTATGLNHPVSGVTPILNNTWYHAAATYDGTTWRLYLNGNPEATLVVGAYTPRYDSIQHAGLGTMLTSSGGANGFFQGLMDEVRVWSFARSAEEIRGTMYREVSTATGLIGRWNLNEAAGTNADDSTDPEEDGTLTPSANPPTWSTTDRAPVRGLCGHTPTNEGGACTDGSLCTQTDTCASGVCTGSNPIVCVPSDQCHDAGVCQSGSGICTDPAKQDNTPCDDNNPNTGNDVCTGGVCSGSDLCQGVTCNTPPECHAATGATCDPSTGLCAYPPVMDGTSCADADLCDGAETCQGGACTNGTAVACAALSQCHDVGVCDPQTGQCSNPVKTDGTTCNDGLFCTVNDACGSGACTGAARDCADASACTADRCDDDANECVHDPAPMNGTACDDSDACTRADTCQTGACVGSSPVVCTALNQCYLPGVCDPGTGLCSESLPAPDDTPCTDGNACTTSDTCQSGSCTAGAAPDCDDGNACTNDSCDMVSGCRHMPLNCFDNDSCTLDSCAAGVCQHETIVCENETVTGDVSAGAFLTTDTGEGATPADPMATTVTSPEAGTITIHETVATQTPPAGVTFVDLQAEVTAPQASSAAPLRLTFRIDASALPVGLLIDALAVYKDGLAVANCASVPPDVIDPDPCVSARAFLSDGDAQVDVWTSTASTWNFGYGDCGVSRTIRLATTMIRIRATTSVPAGSVRVRISAKG